MTSATKVASAAVTVLLLGATVVVGAGRPLSPAEIRAATERAADNARRAEENTAAAERDTRALATVARNVRSQVETSRHMLETQLELEASARDTAKSGLAIQEDLRGIARALGFLEERLGSLARVAEASLASTSDAADAGDVLIARLRSLEQRFEEVLEESRELNRKARGYDKVRP